MCSLPRRWHCDQLGQGGVGALGIAGDKDDPCALLSQPDRGDFSDARGCAGDGTTVLPSIDIEKRLPSGDGSLISEFRNDFVPA